MSNELLYMEEITGEKVKLYFVSGDYKSLLP